MNTENPTMMNEALRAILSDVSPAAAQIATFRARHDSMPTAVWIALGVAMAASMGHSVTPYLDLLENELSYVTDAEELVTGLRMIAFGHNNPRGVANAVLSAAGR